MIITSYVDPTDLYYQFIRTFNKNPNSFNVEECLKVLKTIQLEDEEEVEQK